jgi:hypothetical protein
MVRYAPPESTVKDVIGCASARSDGSPCATPANEVIHVDGVDQPTGEFHAGLYVETGSLRPISRRTRRRRAQEERERGGNVKVAGGAVRDRVVATAHGVYDRMEQVLVAAMSATKIVTFPCKSWGVKNRVEVPDYTNALRSVELMLSPRSGIAVFARARARKGGCGLWAGCGRRIPAGAGGRGTPPERLRRAGLLSAERMQPANSFILACARACVSPS